MHEEAIFGVNLNSTETSKHVTFICQPQGFPDFIADDLKCKGQEGKTSNPLASLNMIIVQTPSDIFPVNNYNRKGYTYVKHGMGGGVSLFL